MTDWFRLPWGVLRAMADMMHTISNEERLAWITDAAVAGGNLKRHDIRRHISALRGKEQAGPATPEILGAFGIRIEHG